MYRLLPTSIYHIPAMETWLESQARRGNRFDGFLGEFLARFEPGEPREDVYRLEVSGRCFHPPGEAEELYGRAGWEYAGLSPNGDLWVFRAVRPDPSPLHTDPEVQAIAYRWLEQRLRRRTAAWAALLAVCAVLAAVWLWVLMGSIRQLVREPWLPFSNNALWLLGLTVSWLVLRGGDLLALGRLTRTLRAGVPMEHHGVVPGGRRRTVRVMALLAAGYFVLAAFSVAACDRDRMFLDWRGPLAECPEKLPYVSVETLGAVSRTPSPFAVGERSALGEAYTICDGDVTYAGWGETVSGYVGWTDAARQGRTEFYRLRPPVLGGLLAREIARKELPADAVRLEDARFDDGWYGVETGGAQHLLLRDGRRVLWMRAEAPEDLRSHLEEFAAVFEGAA